MLSQEDNELLCRVGPGTPMGNLMREYWIPAVRSDELPAPDCAPMRVRLLGEDLIAFRTTSGEAGDHPERLPAPWRLAVLRAQRRRRPALRVPRLEVRRYRRLRRYAFRACREQLQGQGAREGVPRARAGRHHLGVHGRPYGATAAAGPRGQHARRWPVGNVPVLHAVQLDARLGRRDGHRPRGLPALRRHPPGRHAAG